MVKGPSNSAKMRIQDSHVLAATDILHVCQALCALIAACLAIAIIATADVTGPPIVFHLALVRYQTS